MATIKKISDNSKSYLNRLVVISGVLNALIELVEVEQSELLQLTKQI